MKNDDYNETDDNRQFKQTFEVNLSLLELP